MEEVGSYTRDGFNYGSTRVVDNIGARFGGAGQL
jgi:hypothetical protein